MKTLRNALLLTIVILYTISCSKKADIVETDTEFIFVDDNGDIFRENNPYHLSISDFDVYPNIQRFRHHYYQGKNYFSVFLDNINQTTYIKFGNINTDTIKIETAESGRISYIKRLWYNGKELQIHKNRTYQCDVQTITFKVD